MLRTSTVAAALLAAAAPIATAGSAAVVNKCDYDVHLWTADMERGQKGPHFLSAGATWAEEYYMVGSGSPANGGVSIKLSTSDNCEGAITQLEYTLSADESPDLWYDISNVNCEGTTCPFYHHGFFLDAPTTVSCGPLTAICDAVYNEWNDDTATHGTTSSKDLTLHLCGENGKSANSISYATPSSATPSSSRAGFTSLATSVKSHASSTPTPTPTPAPTFEISTHVEAADVEPANGKPNEIHVVVTQVEIEYETAYATVWAKRTPTPKPHAHHGREHHEREHHYGREQHHGHPHWRK